MIKLNVWLTLEETTSIHAGELIVSNPDTERGGALQGQFRYSQKYLECIGAFPLDPIHLPLSNTIFDADRPRSGIHGVFEDSLPDDWGRRLLIRRYNIARVDQRPAKLLEYLASSGMGALSYSTELFPPLRENRLGVKHLLELQRLASNFEEDPASVGDEYSILFQAGSSPGGARPKVLVQDIETAYIAKFESIKDQFDVVGFEAAAMELARQAGVDSAVTRCVPCGSSRALLVKRFDRDCLAKKFYHVITMQTLLDADDYYHLAYRDMADIIRKVSSEPLEDLKKLFRQLVFNVLIGNTDDHLKNFSMICDGSSWRLSPAYDIVPNIGQNREHVLSINYSNSIPNHTSLLSEAKYFGFKQERKVKLLIDEVVAVVKNWKELFTLYGIPSRDIEIIGRDIENRLSIMCS